ncbi:MAG: large subunit ribosomal protein L21 [Rhodospirillaceae bacterium]|nr:MAG: large subunit ribosomal protein L21 [Rhodospirillaceae bacterium]
MFAVIKTGGKQYKVAKDSILAIEKIDGDPGAAITFTEVLMLGETIGGPVVSGASVTGEILRQFKDDKILVFKKRRRKNYRRKKGHRQNLTLVKITELARERQEGSNGP